MKFTQVFLLATLSFLAFASNAQGTQARKPSAVLQGMTVAGHLGSVSATISTGLQTAHSDNPSQNLGVKIGYAKLEENSLGFLGRLNLVTKVSGVGWDDYTFLRPELNAAFAPTDSLYFFGGLSLASFVGGELEKMEMGKGLQLGLGFVVSSSAFCEFQYVTTTHGYRGVDVTLNSFELSVGTTF